MGNSVRLSQNKQKRERERWQCSSVLEGLVCRRLRARKEERSVEGGRGTGKEGKERRKRKTISSPPRAPTAAATRGPEGFSHTYVNTHSHPPVPLHTGHHPQYHTCSFPPRKHVFSVHTSLHALSQHVKGVRAWSCTPSIPSCWAQQLLCPSLYGQACT